MFQNLAGKKWPFIVGGMIFLIIIGNSANVSRNSSPESSSSASSTVETEKPVEVAKPLGGYCAGTMASLDDVVQMLGNAVDYPLPDITSKLRDKGEMFVYGYDSTMIPTASELELVKDAGHQMLQIRARLVDGGDALVPGQALLKSYAAIGAICR